MRQQLLHPVLLFVAIVAEAGCADAGGIGGDQPFSAKDSAGVNVVDVWGPSPEPGGGWRLAPQPTVTIGVIAGQSEFEFSYVVGALRLAADTIVVLDDEAGELRFFDGGRWGGRFGR